jgi:hypothetical protein
MDVFSADGVYVGTVIHIIRRAILDAATRRTAEGSSAAPVSGFSGEALGPMPTSALGNRGPRQQSAVMAFASSAASGQTDPSTRPAELIVLRSLVALNRATLMPTLRRIPVTMVQLVSMERIVLSSTAAELA